MDWLSWVGRERVGSSWQLVVAVAVAAAAAVVS
jgi:hypothetical protein